MPNSDEHNTFVQGDHGGSRDPQGPLPDGRPFVQMFFDAARDKADDNY